MRKIILSILLLAFIDDGYGQNVVLPALDLLIKYPAVRDFTISQDGKETYFTIQNLTFDISIIASVTKNEESWYVPSIVSFSGTYKDLEPFLAPDGLRLYFVSDRPLSDTSHIPKDFDIWYVERKSVKNKWSMPKNIGSPINTQNDEFYPSVTLNQNLYFTCDCPNSIGHDDIFVSYWDKQYKTPILLDSSVNTKSYEFNAYVSPDESFIIYSGFGRKDGIGNGDLYINFKKEDGSWGKSENLGEEINSKNMDYCPFVDIKTRTLYFTSSRYKPSKKNINSIDDYLKEVSKYENGSSRIYKTSIDNILKAGTTKK